MRRLALSAVLLCLAILPAMGSDALAANTCTFNGAAPSPLWTVPANWDTCGGVAPGAADDAIVPAGKTVFLNSEATVGSLTLGGADMQLFSGHKLTVTGTVTVSGPTATTVSGSGTISSGGAFLKQDAGTLTISPGVTLALLAPWSQTGGTISVDATSPTAIGQITGASPGTISGGGLVISGKVTSLLTLTTPAILAGTGTIIGTLTNTSGTVRPGPASSTPGRLTVTGAFAQAAGGTLELTLTNPDTFDVLAVSGDASLDGTVKVSSSPVAAITDEFRFLTAGTLSGPGFSAITGNAAPAGGTYQLNYNPPDGTTAARLLLQDPVVPALAGPFTGPTITPSGALDPGATLTCSPGTWTGNPKFSYSWLREGTPIAGQTGTTYTLTLADGLTHLACRVTATATGGIVPADSPSLAAEGFVPVNTVLPTTTPFKAPGDTTTCSPGTWTAAPAPAFTYLWLRDGYVIVGQTDTSYTITLTDVGTEISCLVNADNSAGSKAAESKRVKVPAVIPANTALPKLSGSNKLGSTLSCATGTWSGTPTATLTYEWLRAGQPIDGETQPTYDLDFADGNRAITCRITATNLAGSVQAVSAPIKVEKNTEQRFNSLGFDKIATAIGMPAAKACRRPATMTITMRAPSGVSFKSIATKVASRKNKTVKSGSRFKTTFNVRSLKNRKLKKFTVSVTIKTTTPITIHAKRVYKIC